MPVSTANGLNIHYEVAGDGPPMMLVHANPFDHRLWMYQVARFSARFRVVAVDLRGYGRSDKPTDAFTFDDMVGDVLGVMRDEGIDRAVLMGASVGSSIALRIGLDHPEQCDALVLVGGSSGVSPSFHKRIEGFRGAGIDGYRRPYMDELVAPPFRDSALGRSLLDMFCNDTPPLSAAALVRVFEAMLGRDMTDRLPTLVVPTLVVNGAHDMSLEAGRLTASTVPGAIHRVIPDTGHVCNLEDPAAFDVIVADYLRARGLMDG